MDARPASHLVEVHDWLTVEEVAEQLRIPLKTAYAMARDGRIRSIKIGRHRRVRRAWLEALEGRPRDARAGQDTVRLVAKHG